MTSCNVSFVTLLTILVTDFTWNSALGPFFCDFIVVFVNIILTMTVVIVIFPYALGDETA